MAKNVWHLTGDLSKDGQMPFRAPHIAKPRLLKTGNLWLCHSRLGSAVAESAAEAYKWWEFGADRTPLGETFVISGHSLGLTNG